MADQVENLNAGIRRPSKLPFIDGGRVPALKLLPAWIVANSMGQNGEGQIQLFNIWRQCQEKKTKFVPLRSAPSYAAIRKATILTPASIVYQ